MTRRFPAFIAAALVLLAVSGARAETPTAFLQNIDKKVKPLLAGSAQNKDRILKLLNQMLDFPTLCKDALGRHWEGRTDAQRKEFSDTLHALIEKNVVKRLKDTRTHKVRYESEEVAGEAATVVTVVSDGDGPRATQIEIAYKLRRKGASWGVVDMVTDGVSLVSNYRSQFNKIITQEGWDAVIRKMKDKLAEPDAPKAARGK